MPPVNNNTSLFSIHIRVVGYGSLTSSLVHFVSKCLSSLPVPFIAHLLTTDIHMHEQYIPSLVQHSNEQPSSLMGELQLRTTSENENDLQCVNVDEDETSNNSVQDDDEEEDSDMDLTEKERAEKEKHNKQEAIQREIERIKKW